jgi:hypothetical protein
LYTACGVTATLLSKFIFTLPLAIILLIDSVPTPGAPLLPGFFFTKILSLSAVITVSS